MAQSACITADDLLIVSELAEFFEINPQQAVLFYDYGRIPQPTSVTGHRFDGEPS